MRKFKILLSFVDSEESYKFSRIGSALQTVIRSSADPDLFRVLFDEYSVFALDTGRGHAVLIVRDDAIKNGALIADEHPEKQEIRGFFESALYEKSGRIFYHRFSDAPGIVVLTSSKKPVGFITEPVRYTERGFES